MNDYWIVVKRGKEEIRTILEIAFRGRNAFTIIEDRRVQSRRVPRKSERRKDAPSLQLQDFLVAERRDI